MAEGARLESVYTGNRIEGSNPSPSAKQARGVRLWRRKGAAGYPNGLICLPLWIPRRPLRRRHGSLEPPAGAVRRALRLWLAVSPPSSGDERSALAQSTSWGRRLVTAWIQNMAGLAGAGPSPSAVCRRARKRGAAALLT